MTTRASLSEVWSVDTEWGYRGGYINQEAAWEPVVLCLTGQESGRQLSFWRRDPGLLDFFQAHKDDLFVAHYAVAEMKYLLRLGAPLPARWFDTFVAWRCLKNQPGHLDAGLAQALVSLGVPGLAPSVKSELQKKILHLQFDLEDPAARAEITDYCLGDCRGCASLYERVKANFSVEVMAYWTAYLQAVSRMELRGIPLDVGGYTRIMGKWPAFKSALLSNINGRCHAFDGARFSRKALLRWCRDQGIAWPTRRSNATGKVFHSFDADAMMEMESRHPFLAELRQVLKTQKHMQKQSITVDPVHRRHYFSTSVFRSITGRNQPRNFIFSAPKWMRHLIVPESPEHVLVYVDYIAQEIRIAAAMSHDEGMRAMYEADDCHMAFAIRAGAAPAGATKETHADVRKRYKTVNLGTLYGQTAFGIGHRLGISSRDAERLLAEHHGLFPEFWRWSEAMVQRAYDQGEIRTACGWRCKVPFTSNSRTWMNWPMQAAGADIMRLTMIYLDRQSVRILAPVHDGFLLSCRRRQLDDLRAAVDYACTAAVEHVLPGFPLRWETSVYDGRFADEDGRPLWDTLQTLME